MRAACDRMAGDGSTGSSSGARLGRWRAVVLAAGLGLAACSAWSAAPEASDDPRGARPELAYLEAVNRVRPPEDPQLLFLLSSQYANANRQAEGIAFFEERLRDFRNRLSPAQEALYLTALASLRAGEARRRPWYSRLGWVKDTVAMLDEAKRLTQGRVFVVRWMSGVVRAQLPGLLGERDAALADLRWCEANAGSAPHGGWLREV